MKTKIEIIDEVVSHIEGQGRAINEKGSCVYLTSDGKVCGHSLFLTDEARIKANGAAEDLILDKGDIIHKEEYRGHSPKFWQCIQDLHDCASYWSKDNVLNSLGSYLVAYLKSKYHD